MFLIIQPNCLPIRITKLNTYVLGAWSPHQFDIVNCIDGTILVQITPKLTWELLPLGE